MTIKPPQCLIDHVIRKASVVVVDGAFDPKLIEYQIFARYDGGSFTPILEGYGDSRSGPFSIEDYDRIRDQVGPSDHIIDIHSHLPVFYADGVQPGWLELMTYNRPSVNRNGLDDWLLYDGLRAIFGERILLGVIGLSEGKPALFVYDVNCQKLYVLT